MKLIRLFVLLMNTEENGTLILVPQFMSPRRLRIYKPPTPTKLMMLSWWEMELSFL